MAATKTGKVTQQPYGNNDEMLSKTVYNSKVEFRVDYNSENSIDGSIRLFGIPHQFTAENEKVKEIIESNFNSLKDMLNEQGVQVSSLSVSVGSDDTANERQHFGFEQNKSSRRINDIINAPDSPLDEEI